MSDGKRSVRVTFKGGMSGRLFKVHGSDRWYLSYWHAALEYRETTGTADFDAAKKELRKKLDELAAVRRGAEPFVGPKMKRVTVNELLDALKVDFKLRSVKGHTQALSHMEPLRDAFGPWRAIEMTSDAVDRQIERWLAEGVAPATINRRTQILGQAFRFGHTSTPRRVVSVPTFRRLPENNARRGFVTPEQFEAIAARLADPYNDCARLAYMIGWRKGELQQLTAANVDLRAGELRIGDSKNGDGRVVPFRNEDSSLNAIGQLIERRLAARVVGNQMVPWLFHRAGRPIGDFRKAWASACIAAGFSRPKLDKHGHPVRNRKGSTVMLPTVLFHDLRRSFAKDAVDSGNDPKTVMDIGGWRTVSVFHRYQIVDTRQMAKALSRLEVARTSAPSSAVVIPLAEAVRARSR